MGLNLWGVQQDDRRIWKYGACITSSESRE